MKTKQIILILLVLLLAAPFSSCKKEYPKDIPGWLKTKIKKLDKDTRKNGCGDTPLVITECKNVSTGDIIYAFYYNEMSSSTNIYDYNGNLECTVDEFWTIDSCNGVAISTYSQRRTIWIQRCKD